MLGSRDLVVAGAVVTALLIGVTAGAEAKPVFTAARFSITVSGTQTSTWSLDSTTFDGCVQGDIRQTGSGRQSFSFKTPKPATLTAIKIDKSVIISGTRLPGAPVKGSLSRSGDIRTEQLSGDPTGCGDGGGSPPTAPDCGTKPFAARVDLEWTTPDQYQGEPPVPLVPVLLLEGPVFPTGSSGFSSLFQHCVGGGPDQLIPTPNSSLALKKLFGKVKRFTVRGADKQTTDSDGYRVETTVNWVATFKRLPRLTKAPPPQPPGGLPQCMDGRDNNGNGKIDFPQDPGCTSATDATE
jgi:hypothetical protein